MKFSILYALIRPEIKERLSIGIIIIKGNEVKIRYSEKKLKALKGLYPICQYKFIARSVRSLHKNKSIRTIESIEYLSKYSNNIIDVSRIESIDLEPTSQNEDWLYSNYVYKKRT